MIAGTVSSRRPTVPLLVRGPAGPEARIETVLDTGFNGFLTLPPSAVATLGLPLLGYLRAAVADGTRVRLQICGAVLVWHEEEREIEVLSTGRDAILGTALLDGHEVRIQFVDGGLVRIEPL